MILGDTVKKIVILLLVCLMLVSGCEKKVPVLMQEYHDTKAFSGQSYSAEPIKGNQFSLLIWLKSKVNYPWTSLFSMGDDSFHYMQVSLNGTDLDGNLCGINFAYRDGETIERVFSSPENQVELNIYNQIAITYDSEYLIVYLNGKEIGRKECIIQLSEFASEDIVIGKSLFFDDPQIDGEYNSLIVSNKVLSVEEIQQNFEERYPFEIMSTLPFLSESDVQFMNLPENPYHGYYLSYFLEENDWIHLSGNQLVQSSYPLSTTTVDMKTVIEHKGKIFERIDEIPVYSQYDYNIYIQRQWIQNTLGYYVENETILPNLDLNGKKISWSVDSGECSIQCGILYKNSDKEYEECILIASSDANEYLIPVLVTDRYTGYIMSYFNGEEGNEKANLAYSLDGLNWEKLDKSEGFLKTELGTQRIRDPYIARNADGGFIVLATQGYNTNSIYYWASNDLVHFTDNKLIRSSHYDFHQDMSGTRAWAPELFYDALKNEYYVIFSDTGRKEGGMYYLKTSDFVEFSYPQSFFDPGYLCIDGTVSLNNGKQYLFYKDERDGATTVYYASGNHILNLTDIQDKRFISLTKKIEGPFVISSLDESKTYLFVDNYPNHRFEIAEVDFEAHQFRWLNDFEFSLPEDEVRHCSIIKVTEKELQRVLNAYK